MGGRSSSIVPMLLLVALVGTGIGPALVVAAQEEDGKIVPLFTQEPVLIGGQRLHVVDPWIRPPRNSTRQYAVDVPGDFDGYPRIEAKPLERINFVHRTIGRTQRHGVYIITNKTLVQDYLDGATEHPCGPNIWTQDAVCQVASDTGLNGTNCLNRVTLFPLMEIFGSTGAVEYTTPELGYLADAFGIETESGSKILAFDCPWVQGRPNVSNTPGRTSHCIGGMFVIAEVACTDESCKTLTSSTPEALPGSFRWTFPIISLSIFGSVVASLV